MARNPQGRALRLLLDTNIFIAYEDDSVEDPHVNAAAAATLIRTARELGFELLVSSGTGRDVLRAPPELAARRRRALEKYYQQLAAVADNPDIRKQFPAELTSNNRADLEVLSTFAAGVATALVTEDAQMRARAARAGLRNVFSLEEAIDWVTALRAPTLRNAVAARIPPAYQVNTRAPLFDSLRSDYRSFDTWWLDKVVNERRHVIVLDDPGDPTGIAVLKAETGEFGLGDDVLKICTFKTAEGSEQSRRGELLLRAVVDYAAERQHPVAYMTVRPHHEKLLGWLELFGFSRRDVTPDGQYVMAKAFVPQLGDAPEDPLAHQIRYGPRSILVERAYVIPIQAQYHARLFPDSESQVSLLENDACGNAIRKAYLCHASIRRLAPGDAVLFVRTEPRAEARVAAVGVVEETLASGEPDQIAAFVEARSVYSYDEIRAMCDKGEVLAVRFRLDRRIYPPWGKQALISRRVIASSPQSIATVRAEGVAWLRAELSGR